MESEHWPALFAALEDLRTAVFVDDATEILRAARTVAQTWKVYRKPKDCGCGQ